MLSKFVHFWYDTYVIKNRTLIVLYYLYRGKSVNFDHLRHSDPNTPPLYTATLPNMFDALSSVVSVYALFDLMLKGRKSPILRYA